MIKETISDLLAQSDNNTQLVDRYKVIDHLLDLRVEALGDERLRAQIDAVLAQVPGVTVVSRLWWRSTLQELAQSLTQDALV